MSKKRDGWNADAAQGATGQSFEIVTVADFLKVPADRRRICLREFHAWLSLAEEMPRIIQDYGEAIGYKREDVQLRPRMESFVWHDDGAAKMGVEIVSK